MICLSSPVIWDFESASVMKVIWSQSDRLFCCLLSSLSLIQHAQKDPEKNLVCRLLCTAGPFSRKNVRISRQVSRFTKIIFCFHVSRQAYHSQFTDNIFHKHGSRRIKTRDHVSRETPLRPLTVVYWNYTTIMTSRRLFRHNPASRGTNQPIRKSEFVKCMTASRVFPYTSFVLYRFLRALQQNTAQSRLLYLLIKRASKWRWARYQRPGQLQGQSSFE